jgi:hypothetical protein
MQDDKLKFVLHRRKEGDKFVLEGITKYIFESIEVYNDKTTIITFEMPVTTTNAIKLNICELINLDT